MVGYRQHLPHAMNRDRPVTPRQAHPLAFPVTMWGLSRLWILLGLLGIAPLLQAPPGGEQALFHWSAFTAWDSTFYASIATTGYSYIADGQGHNVAFFPMLPLLIRGVMVLGFPFEVAGVLVTNGAFLISVILLYRWLQGRKGEAIARWAVIVLVWCPFSLFGTVVYTESVFLAFSIATLAACDRRDPLQTALWGACATAARLPGLALVPALLITAWCQRRTGWAYLAALSTGLGAGLYSLFCWLQFGDPLAFLNVQQAWAVPDQFYGQGWLIMFGEVFLGPGNIGDAGFTDPVYPLVVLLLIGLGIAVARSRFRGRVYAGGALFVLAWLVAGDPLLNLCMVLGSLALLWRYRAEIPATALLYGFLSFLGILSHGRTISLERHTYGIVTVAIAVGIWLHYHPKLARVVVSFSGLILLLYSIRFAQSLWIA
ncbi:mannosyltransferase family protein [Spirulina major CS-329]|uniref:mannosyltransferase family protein n=1 Tax=Spirulina TaxID=1154 RepID=UPI00232D8069|nr:MULTISPECIES: mannosyltransferase family protein [Spirulina]MDB9496808.1 mannosyltransferase family protein [Spirulina subsalsa CS-330]MDB9502889.1 mannosyltransferase family protein [Spirulina major CS-329]